MNPMAFQQIDPMDCSIEVDPMNRLKAVVGLMVLEIGLEAGLVAYQVA